ncbi:DOMON-like domain-containing protein [Cyanobium sp. N5-Cardenillas]|uniref:DOMON-like domain-containing protein n=1 Tax=Cyanobium sp. N5-Cardenillas TaxID=2823720 RepID=UPI0020CC2DE1|nr:DOMON-like domain-containing protein [Cyanobium sp. N5-Cardenillas]MCP9786866.1 DOMON-like domain-containing protein [Cyanobium sp. N5-Cardenillas]
MAASVSQRFELRPFDGGRASPALELGGEIDRQGRRLLLRLRLAGAIASVRLPVPVAAPARRDGLWATTCFECFWGVEGARPYWELNLSPAGHWNLYRLEDYRDGLRPEPGYDLPPHRVVRDAGALTLHLDLPLPEGLAAEVPLQVGITSVIEECSGRLSYWALAHPGAEPDFHRREAFLLRL